MGRDSIVFFECEPESTNTQNHLCVYLPSRCRHPANATPTEFRCFERAGLFLRKCPKPLFLRLCPACFLLLDPTESFAVPLFGILGLRAPGTWVAFSDTPEVLKTCTVPSPVLYCYVFRCTLCCTNANMSLQQTALSLLYCTGETRFSPQAVTSSRGHRYASRSPACNDNARLHLC